MTDDLATMHRHVALRLRLVYESTGSGTDVPGWRLVGLLPEGITDASAAGHEPGAAGSLHHGSSRFVTDPVALSLDRDEAEGYYLNLTSPEPSLFALIRLPDVASATAARCTEDVPQAEAVTASYAEASRWMDGGMVVIRTALPEPMLAWIAEFAQHHYQVEGKKPRGKFRPSFLSRREFGEVARAEQVATRASPEPARAGRDVNDTIPTDGRRH